MLALSLFTDRYQIKKDETTAVCSMLIWGETYAIEE